MHESFFKHIFRVFILTGRIIIEVDRKVVPDLLELFRPVSVSHADPGGLRRRLERRFAGRVDRDARERL
jgi:hypothetical protein